MYLTLTVLQRYLKDATTSNAGVVELATTAEALAGTNTSNAVTPAGLAARSYRTAIGDGTATSIAVHTISELVT